MRINQDGTVTPETSQDYQMLIKQAEENYSSSLRWLGERSAWTRGKLRRLYRIKTQYQAFKKGISHE